MKQSKITFGSLKSLKDYSSVILIYDSGLKKYKSDLVKKISNKNIILVPVVAKETSKNISQVIKIYKTLSKQKVDKKSVLVALGGGVIGDIAGFVASTYLRGVPFVSVPTTILSQVDSSLGGKNGVRLDRGKNLVGTFYQPAAVFIDYNYLKTLSQREVISGLG